MNKEPLLSICIPTYNREVYLKRLLDSIVSQKGFSDDIEIVIDDGPSKDNTQLMVAEYQKKYPNIRYFRNTKAVWMTAAFLESIDLSKGKYTRLFGSDDFMTPDALSIVLSVIKEKSPTVLLSNRTSYTEHTNHILPKHPRVHSFAGFVDFAKFLGQDDPAKYVDKVIYFTFISVFCFETAYYKEMLAYIEKEVSLPDMLKKDYFNFALVVYANLPKEKTICVVEDPRLVYVQGWAENHSWHPNKKIPQDFKFLIDYLIRHYSLEKSAIKFFKRAYLW